MSKSALIQPRRSDEEHVDLQREPFRPAKPARRGPGYLLRHLAGVDEAILNWAPEERHRYTRLGAIVLNTGLMAALSILVLLASHDMPIALVIPAAVFWGYLILSFDRWLVSNTHGTSGMGRSTFVARLLISILMGLVIAEPLLLWIFRSDIQTQINNDRGTIIDKYESTLKRCNPLSGAPPQDSAGCTTEFVLNAPGAPQQLQESLTVAQSERQKAADAVNAINTELTRRQDLARRECNGTPGDGLTGKIGEGPNCHRLRDEADEYLRSSGLTQRRADLDVANKKVADLQTQLTDTGKVHADAVSATITQKVTDKRDGQRTPGLLDQERALDTLTRENPFALIQSWLLRLLLIVIDCLPVLTKKMSRTTTYDALLSRQLNIDGRLHDKSGQEREQHEIGHLNVRIRQNEHNVRLQLEEIDEQSRAVKANREAGLDEQIEALAQRLRGEI